MGLWRLSWTTEASFNFLLVYVTAYLIINTHSFLSTLVCAKPQQYVLITKCLGKSLVYCHEAQSYNPHSQSLHMYTWLQKLEYKQRKHLLCIHFMVPATNLNSVIQPHTMSYTYIGRSIPCVDTPQYLRNALKSVGTSGACFWSIWQWSAQNAFPRKGVAVHTSGRPRLGMSATQCWIYKQHTIPDIYQYIIGASLSEPHINVLNASSVCLYVYMHSYIIPEIRTCFLNNKSCSANLVFLELVSLTAVST